MSTSDPFGLQTADWVIDRIGILYAPEGPSTPTWRRRGDGYRILVVEDESDTAGLLAFHVRFGRPPCRDGEGWVGRRSKLRAGRSST